MYEISVPTKEHTTFINITSDIQKQIDLSTAIDGVCIIYVPHTTAGIMINENADPDVLGDLKHLFKKTAPWKDPNYRHFEGNTAAHFNASLCGSSVTVIIENGRLMLGRWQGIFFSEFDGPRNRKVWIKVLENGLKDSDI